MAKAVLQGVWLPGRGVRLPVSDLPAGYKAAGAPEIATGKADDAKAGVGWRDDAFALPQWVANAVSIMDIRYGLCSGAAERECD